jgi:hypothetical protein
VHAGKWLRAEIGGDLDIQIPLLPVREDLSLLDAETETRLEKKFQAQLLSYRLANCTKVRTSTFDPKQLVFPTREIARSLGSCFPHSPDLQEEIVTLLRGTNAHLRVAQSLTVESVLIEALLFLCHEAQGDLVAGVHAGQLAQHIRVISRDRGDEIDLKPRAVGELLRGLGFTTERLDRYGRGILLCQEVIERVHELAAAFHVPAMGRAQRCALCAKARQGSVARGDKS